MDAEMERESGERESVGRVSGRRRDVRRSTTIFIGNLPKKLDKYGLGGIFKRFARIKSSIIINRRSSNSNFGFIEVWSLLDAKNCINQLNRSMIHGNKIIVDWAKEKSNWNKKRVQIWVPKPKRNNEAVKANYRFSGVTNDEFMEWLSRSLVCTSHAPRDLDALAYLIKDNYGPISKITALSGVKFILTFASYQEMNDALANPLELNDWFSDIKPWLVYETSESRRVWVDIIGVPPHGWVWENFKKCVHPWGKLLSLARSISSSNQFEVMRALIQTEVFLKLEGEVVLDIQNCAFKVFIREVTSHLIPPSMVYEHGPNEVVEPIYSSESDESKQENDDDLQDRDVNCSVDDAIQSHKSMPRFQHQYRAEGSQRDGSLELEAAEEPEIAINLSLTSVPVNNDQQLVNMTAALGSDAAVGVEKSVEILKDSNHLRELESSNHDALPSSQNSENERSLSSNCESIVNARAYIVEKTIKFGEETRFMRAKRNTNPRKYLEDKLSSRKRKKAKESARRKKALPVSSASLSF